MIGNLARRGIPVEVALDTVITCSADVDGAALHEEVFGAVDTVAHCLGDIDGGVFQCHVFTGLDAVLGIAHHIECAFLGKLGVSFDIEASFL